MKNMDEMIKPVASSEYSTYFIEKCLRYFKGEAKDWEFEINLFIENAKKFGNGKRVLDIGCGTGTLLFVFSKHGFESYGVDFDHVQIDAAKKMAKKLKITNIHFYQSKIGDIPFEEQSFDIIVSEDVVEHLPDEVLELFLEQSYRYLKKNGILLIFTQPTKYTYLYCKKYVWLLIPFFFLNEPLFKKYLKILDYYVPRIMKKITGKIMQNTWQTKPPGHCNCHELEHLLKMVNKNGFKTIIAKSLINPHQRYFQFLMRIFPFETTKPNIFIVAKKEL